MVFLQLSTLNPRCYFHVGSTQYFLSFSNSFDIKYNKRCSMYDTLVAVELQRMLLVSLRTSSEFVAKVGGGRYMQHAII